MSDEDRAFKSTPAMKSLSLSKSTIPTVESKNLISLDAAKIEQGRREGEKEPSPIKENSPEKALITKSMTIAQENIDFTDDAVFYLGKASGNRSIRRSNIVNELLSIFREEYDKKTEDGRLFKMLAKRLTK